jgi:ribonuclease HI
MTWNTGSLPHPAKAVSIKEVETHEEATISTYTDGSKCQRGVGSGVVIFKGSDIIARQKLKLKDKCSNNQAEQIVIHKTLEEKELLSRKSISPLTAIIYTDSRVSLDSLHNPNNHEFLVEEIRKKVPSLERSEWRINFSWVKVHAGAYGNEIADRLAKEAARSTCSPGYLKVPYTKKPKRKPGKNGNAIGQGATKRLQPDNIFPQSRTD